MSWIDKIHKETFSVAKTARCFTYGNESVSTQHVWLVFHGYGQLATGVIKPFTNLDENRHYVIAPEGLSRFYVEGVYGKVGASWMTKEDRELDIMDQFTYLDRVADKYLKQFRGREVKLHILGFSQGVATLTRWLARNPVEPDTIIYWAGSVPVEDIPENNPAFTNAAIHCLVGTEDEYISESKFDDMVEQISARTGKDVTTTKFKGKHKITTSALKKLAKALS